MNARLSASIQSRKRGSEIVAAMIVDLVAQMAVEGLEPWQRKDVRR
jgi:hypothetical protein